ncbi:hypothetical protein BDE02_16G011200 [Populus trichocarpa]|nr:hypothetical protein BDE02_16G011200 [Populus trichocarpa]
MSKAFVKGVTCEYRKIGRRHKLVERKQSPQTFTKRLGCKVVRSCGQRWACMIVSNCGGTMEWMWASRIEATQSLSSNTIGF